MARIFIILTLLMSIDGMARERIGGRKVDKPERTTERRKEVARPATRRDVGQNVQDDRQTARRAAAYTAVRIRDDGSSEEVECCACPSSMTPAEANVAATLPLETTPAY